jgi:ribosome-binding protein aMBF1 (putative translation factor)
MPSKSSYPILGYGSRADTIRAVTRNPYSYHQVKLQELLQKMRLEAGMRQEDLAKRIGVPQSFVSKYESGDRRLDFIEVRKVCAALGVSLADFVRAFEEALQ